jgi:mutator protein MutT
MESIAVAAAVIESQGKFLITQRLKTSHLGHLWEFPGGKIEPGESVEACLIRECREEIGVLVKPLKKLEELEHTYPEVNVHLLFWLCEIVSGIPRPLECADCRWVKPEELKHFEFPEADRELIKVLAASHQQEVP